jgi:hypothetical protein
VVSIAEKPTTAFVLSLVGGILTLIVALLILAGGVIAAPAIAALLGPLGGTAIGIVIAIGVLHLIFAILMIVGGIQINKGEPGKVKTWSIIVLVVSIIGLITGAGFFIGALLGLIGGILGLTWKPPAKPPAQATTT